MIDRQTKGIEALVYVHMWWYYNNSIMMNRIAAEHMGFADAILGLWTDCYLFGLALNSPGSYGLMVTNGNKVQLHKVTLLSLDYRGF